MHSFVLIPQSLPEILLFLRLFPSPLSLLIASSLQSHSEAQVADQNRQLRLDSSYV